MVWWSEEKVEFYLWGRVRGKKKEELQANEDAGVDHVEWGSRKKNSYNFIVC